jgi:hypothetical protein
MKTFKVGDIVVLNEEATKYWPHLREIKALIISEDVGNNCYKLITIDAAQRHIIDADMRFLGGFHIEFFEKISSTALEEKAVDLLLI